MRRDCRCELFKQCTFQKVSRSLGSNARKSIVVDSMDLIALLRLRLVKEDSGRLIPTPDGVGIRPRVWCGTSGLGVFGNGVVLYI